MIRVVVADDQDLVRGGFAMILDAQPDLEVVAEAAEGAEAVAADVLEEEAGGTRAQCLIDQVVGVERGEDQDPGGSVGTDQTGRFYAVHAEPKAFFDPSDFSGLISDPAVIGLHISPKGRGGEVPIAGSLYAWATGRFGA